MASVMAPTPACSDGFPIAGRARSVAASRSRSNRSDAAFLCSSVRAVLASPVVFLRCRASAAAASSASAAACSSANARSALEPSSSRARMACQNDAGGTSGVPAAYCAPARDITVSPNDPSAGPAPSP